MYYAIAVILYFKILHWSGNLNKDVFAILIIYILGTGW